MGILFIVLLCSLLDHVRDADLHIVIKANQSHAPRTTEAITAIVEVYCYCTLAWPGLALNRTGNWECLQTQSLLYDSYINPSSNTKRYDS